MNYNFKEYISNKLYRLSEELELNLNLTIATEQIFQEGFELQKNDVIVVLKELASSITMKLITQPVQVAIISEANSLDKAKALFEEFTVRNNETIDYNVDTGLYVKHTYSTPYVVSNFVEVGMEYRSVLYMSGTLLILENVRDLTRLIIDGEEFEVPNFAYQYTMNGNTQPAEAGDNIATTEKSTATFGISFTIPFIDSNFARKLERIASGQISGNTNFMINFQMGNTLFFTNVKPFKLSNFAFSTAKDNIPTGQVSLMR